MRRLAVVLCFLIATAVLGATIEYGAAAGSPPLVTLQSAATAGNGDEVNFRGAFASQTVTLTWSSGCSGGAVVIETSDTTAYAGTWSALATISWSAASRQDTVVILGGVHYLRARVSSTITGGTITVKASARK